MTQITVKVDSNEVKSVVKNSILAVEKLPKRVIKAEVEAARDEAAKYPSELAGQRYIRTGRYGRAFKIEPVGAGYRLSNDAKRSGRRYAKWVGGLADGTGQANIHKNRWVRLYDAILGAQNRIIERANEYFRKVMERNGAP